MTKEVVEIAIKYLPEEFHKDELFKRLFFVEELEQKRQEKEPGKTISLEEVEKIFKEWGK